MNVPTFEAVDSGGNCEFWKQEQVGLSPDQGLSWPHSAHSGSIDILRYIGGLLKQAKWQDLTVRARIQKAEPQKNVLTTFLSVLFFFLPYFVLLFEKLSL